MTPEANISALCHEFTNALTEVLAENAVGLARRGRIARTHAGVKRHPGSLLSSQRTVIQCRSVSSPA
jgi:hypothetical protein